MSAQILLLHDYKFDLVVFLHHFWLVLHIWTAIFSPVIMLSHTSFFLLFLWVFLHLLCVTEYSDTFHFEPLYRCPVPHLDCFMSLCCFLPYCGPFYIFSASFFGLFSPPSKCDNNQRLSGSWPLVYSESKIYLRLGQLVHIWGTVWLLEKKSTLQTKPS